MASVTWETEILSYLGSKVLHVYPCYWTSNNTIIKYEWYSYHKQITFLDYFRSIIVINHPTSKLSINKYSELCNYGQTKQSKDAVK